jgi:hypothetical protein
VISVIATFPFHQHTPAAIEESAPMNIKKALECINDQIVAKGR